VFAVKPSLVVNFDVNQTQDETAKSLGVATPYASGEFNFVLVPA
jgi:hypothetical protein